MANIIHTTSVDFSKKIVSRPVCLVQYDNQIPLVQVSLYNNDVVYSIPSGHTARLRFGKKDGTFVIITASSYGSNRETASFIIPSGATSNYGFFKAVIEIVSDTNDTYVAASSFIEIIIERNPIQNGDVVSQTVATGFPVVTYVSQSLTDAQKSQARANIGATAGTDSIDDVVTEDSPNLIRSGAVFTAIEEVRTMVSSLESIVDEINGEII